MKRLPSAERYTAILLTALALLTALPAFAQVDFSGNWITKAFEEQPERGPGPHIGDYMGLPINDATRKRGDSWSAEKLEMVERQCQQPAADYAPRGPSMLRMWSVVDPTTQAVVSWQSLLRFMLPHRILYMDKRPHPPEWAPHTWQGFSTAEWDGDALKIKTTHLREGWIRRNGLARSEKATMTEYLVRNGDYLTLYAIIDDPVYLTEPLVRSTDWKYDLGTQIIPNECIYSVETEHPRGWVPHYLPGKNQWLHEWSDITGIPYEAMRGGGETMYPEYQKKMARMPVPPPRTNEEVKEAVKEAVEE
ncbi:MAG TPA: hypothetical protein VG892_10655 [Terriglobales bacterium]|jgi:hypothetical protein|nr:hypothetical protein [Terriglobales bacterium]